MKALYIKLLALQKAMKPIVKDEMNLFFHSTYFSINSLLDALRPQLDSIGLVILQPLTVFEGKSALTTILIDPESGETLEYLTPLIENLDPQKMGAIITYTRRFALTSLLLLEAEDSDGNGLGTSQNYAKPSLPTLVSQASLKPIPEATGPSGDTTGTLKTCIICKKPHRGPYSRCYSCYQNLKNRVQIQSPKPAIAPPSPFPDDAPPFEDYK